RRCSSTWAPYSGCPGGTFQVKAVTFPAAGALFETEEVRGTRCCRPQPPFLGCAALTTPGAALFWPAGSPILVQGLVDASRRVWPLPGGRAERGSGVCNGVGHGSEGADSARLADALAAQQCPWAWRLNVHEIDRRHVRRQGHQVVDERGRQRLAVI